MADPDPSAEVRDDGVEAIVAETAAHLVAYRWAALGVLDAGGRPLGSMTAYALDPDHGAFVLHLSRLASHTRCLLERAPASLVIGAADTGEGDPQTLPRLSVQGDAVALDAASADYAAGRSHYLARLPNAEPRFGFADFVLFRLVPRSASWVGGFARARKLSAQRLAAAIARAGELARGS